MSRFQREAEVLASLNHPNIAAIHSLEEASGSRFLVMELVEGETLADRLKRGPLPIGDALNISRQICEALEAAHEKGIVHRDLKPANVKITPDGKVKVLDFGLAKALEGTPAPATLSNSPTVVNTFAGTSGGVILGTAAYMSPEQARGFAADQRRDVFSFGCVLYEMLADRQAFQGETVSDILAAVLAREPNYAQLPTNLNTKILELLRRCLDKNVKRRWHAVADLRIELETAASDVYSNPQTALRGATIAWARFQKLWLVISGILFLTTIALVGVVILNNRSLREATVVRFQISSPDKTTFDSGPAGTTVLASVNAGSLSRSRLIFSDEADTVPTNNIIRPRCRGYDHTSNILGHFASGSPWCDLSENPLVRCRRQSIGMMPILLSQDTCSRTAAGTKPKFG